MTKLKNMNSECKNCGAFHFESEKTSNGNFSSCCHNGKVNLPVFKEVPAQIKALYIGKSTLSKNFLENITKYNKAVCFATMDCKLDPLVFKPGPALFKINGEVSHYTSKSLHPLLNNKREYSQLYILDTTTASEIRVNHPSNSILKKRKSRNYR